AQGEDVVAGIRTPLPIEGLHPRMPAIYDEVLEIGGRLERHYKDMQDIEFTVQDGTLYLLQTRAGKRSARAAVKVARDLVNEHVIDQHTALLRVRPQEVNEAIRPVFDDRDKSAAVQKGRLLARGLPAAPGAAVRKAGFDVREGDWISVDGGTGEVLLDTVKTVEGELGDEVRELLAWADRYRTEGLGVRANADTPTDAQRAREFGAEGIGLVRTEHMFF